jgi:hypothetical protein
MPSIFDKLNLKDQPEIVVLGAPAWFEGELAALSGVTVRRDAAGGAAIHFALAFVATQEELDRASRALIAGAVGDALLWIAYPKGTSKRYACEFNRDSEWTVLRAAGFDTVRQVAIDEDWSALRFRRRELIKTTPKRTRSDASTPRRS